MNENEMKEVIINQMDIRLGELHSRLIENQKQIEGYESLLASYRKEYNNIYSEIEEIEESIKTLWSKPKPKTPQFPYNRIPVGSTAVPKPVYDYVKSKFKTPNVFINKQEIVEELLNEWGREFKAGTLSLYVGAVASDLGLERKKSPTRYALKRTDVKQLAKKMSGKKKTVEVIGGQFVPKKVIEYILERCNFRWMKSHELVNEVSDKLGYARGTASTYVSKAITYIGEEYNCKTTRGGIQYYVDLSKDKARNREIRVRRIDPKERNGVAVIE